MILILVCHYKFLVRCTKAGEYLILLVWCTPKFFFCMDKRWEPTLTRSKICEKNALNCRKQTRHEWVWYRPVWITMTLILCVAVQLSPNQENGLQLSQMGLQLQRKARQSLPLRFLYVTLKVNRALTSFRKIATAPKRKTSYFQSGSYASDGNENEIFEFSRFYSVECGNLRGIQLWGLQVSHASCQIRMKKTVDGTG